MQMHMVRTLVTREIETDMWENALAVTLEIVPSSSDNGSCSDYNHLACYKFGYKKYSYQPRL